MTTVCVRRLYRDISDVMSLLGLRNRLTMALPRLQILKGIISFLGVPYVLERLASFRK